MEFGAAKLDLILFQSLSTDEAQGARYGFWRLDGLGRARTDTGSRTKRRRRNEDGELDLRKRVSTLFLPNVGDHGGKAGSSRIRPVFSFIAGAGGAELWAGSFMR